MAGRSQSREWQFAINRQLWRLNRLGRLKIVDAVIKAELEKLGADRFPDTRRARAGEAAVS
jgi:hypothetical protein